MEAGLKELAGEVEEQCRGKLQDAGIEAIITSRQKSKDSLRKKLYTRNKVFDEGRGYKEKGDILQDIFDLAGVRIALYFPNHNERVKEIIKGTFDVVPKPSKKEESDQSHLENQTDLSKNSAASSQICDDSNRSHRDKFPGYVAEHYRVRIKTIASGTGDHRKRHFNRDRIVEIQVMSVLLHAWAEVNHDIQYKRVFEEASPQEKKILDSLNGLVLTGELLVEQLYDLYIDRTKTPFENKYSLGVFLFKRIPSMEKEVNKAFIDVLRLFLEVLDMDTPETFGSKLKEILAERDNGLHNKWKQKYSPFYLKTPVCIMDYILSTLPPETESKAVKNLKSKYIENKLDTYYCQVILSALVWLLKLFEPSQTMESEWGKQKERFSPEEKSSFEWACGGAKRVDILRGHPTEAREKKCLETLWSWFERQGNSIFSFVFRISKIGVLRELSAEDLRSLINFDKEGWGSDSDDC